MHGIELQEDNCYHYRITYKVENERGDKEERTIPLEYDLRDNKLIPNIVVPSDCMNESNHPVWEKMKQLCDDEITQICQELNED